MERLKGSAGTEFGVPSAAASAEDDPISSADLKRLVGLLEASWATFDAAASKAKGVQLRLGPRGGGRQVPKMIGHVLEAEAAYVHQIGTQSPGAAAPMKQIRQAMVGAIGVLARGEELPEPNKVRRPWSPRYTVRRSAWHALDHAWEIEDRST